MMAINKLVQVGSTMWLDPADIRGVRWIEGSPAIGDVLPASPGYTQVIHRSRGPWESTGFLTSDWPVERVRCALGLTDRTWIYEKWEASRG